MITRTRLFTAAAAGLALLCLAGCRAPILYGGAKRIDSASLRIFLPPFANATDNEHASRALTELTSSALLARGIPLVQTEASLVRSRAENAAGPEGLYLEAARAVRATHLLIGTVHEYRYKNDLNGDPVVGVTLRLVDAQQGRTLWQGSASRVGIWFASLSQTAAGAVHDLVKHIPVAASTQPMP